MHPRAGGTAGWAFCPGGTHGSPPIALTVWDDAPVIGVASEPKNVAMVLSLSSLPQDWARKLALCRSKGATLLPGMLQAGPRVHGLSRSSTGNAASTAVPPVHCLNIGRRDIPDFVSAVPAVGDDRRSTSRRNCGLVSRTDIAIEHSVIQEPDLATEPCDPQCVHWRRTYPLRDSSAGLLWRQECT
jgi:hypothetical protein